MRDHLNIPLKRHNVDYKISRMSVIEGMALIIFFKCKRIEAVASRRVVGYHFSISELV